MFKSEAVELSGERRPIMITVKRHQTGEWIAYGPDGIAMVARATEEDAKRDGQRYFEQNGIAPVRRESRPQLNHVSPGRYSVTRFSNDNSRAEKAVVQPELPVTRVLPGRKSA